MTGHHTARARSGGRAEPAAPRRERACGWAGMVPLRAFTQAPTAPRRERACGWAGMVPLRAFTQAPTAPRRERAVGWAGANGRSELGARSRLLRTCTVAAIAAVAAGCSPPVPASSGPAEVPRAAPDSAAAVPPIIAMQRGRRGGRLVFLDERGVRVRDLTEIGPVPLRDNSPVWSPDGRWVVFASSRTRPDMLATSLWIVAPTPGALPRRLTSGDFDDRDPAWLPDSSGVVFASNRDGSFDLWRLEIAPGPRDTPIPAGPPEKLTARPSQALHPSPSPDGRRIVYTEADLEDGRSELWLWEAGQVRRLTEGPADSTPAWSPDGRTIAFAAPPAAAPPDDAGEPADLDLFLMAADGGDRRPLVTEPLSLQNHPVWSPDGRYLFCTSLFRSVENGKPILSSVTYLDLREQPPVLRALHDPLVVESRASPTLRRGPLDAARLHHNPGYREALNDAIAKHLIQLEQSQP